MAPLIEQRVFRIDRPAQPTLVLKDCGVRSGAPIWNFPFHARVMRHLEAGGVAVPVLIPDRTGRFSVEYHGRTYTVSKYLHAGVPPDDPAELDVLYNNIGCAIGDIHTSLATFPMDGVSDETWRQDLATEARRWAADVASIARYESVMRRFEREHLAALEEALSGLPKQLIHRDCHLGNVIVDGTAVVGFVDCDHFCIGPRILDLAYFFSAIAKWLMDDDEAIDEALRRFSLLLSGYAERCELSVRDRAALPYTMIGVALNFAWWFKGRGEVSAIGVDVHALDWMMQNMDRLSEVSA